MKTFHASENLEIVNNLEAVLSVMEMGDKDMAVQVKNLYEEMAKEHSIIPFVIFTNKREVFDPTATVGSGDFKLLMLNPATRELVAHLWINMNEKTIHRVVTED